MWYLIITLVAAFILLCFYFSQKQVNQTEQISGNESLSVKDFMTGCVNDNKDCMLYGMLAKKTNSPIGYRPAVSQVWVMANVEDIARNGGKSLQLINGNGSLYGTFFAAISKCHDDLDIQKMIFGVTQAPNGRYVLRYQMLAEAFLTRWDLNSAVKVSMRKYPELKQIWIAYEQYRDIRTGEMWCKKSPKS